jgi:uncharacterized protein
MTRRFALATVALLAIAAFPKFTAPVVDEADALSETTEQALNAALESFQQRTGHQLAVAVIETTGDDSLEEYSIDLAREWGVGDEDDDDGVLLLIAVDDRELRIEVGRGLEGDLTDSQAGRIIREQITPRFRSGDYDGGVTAGVDAIRAQLGDTEAVAPQPITDQPPAEESWWPLLAFGLFMAFMVFGGIAGGRRRRGFGMGGPIIWGGGFGGGGGGFGGGGGGFGGGGGGFGGGGGGGFGGGGASGGW